MRRFVRHPRLLAPALIAAVGVLPLLVSAAAYAHPLGNFTINRYARVEVYSHAVQVHYVIDMAEIPTFQLVSDIDTDGDGKASQPELDAYAARERGVLANNFALTIAGKKHDVTPLDTSIQLLPGQGGLDVLRLAVVYQAPVPESLSGATTIEFADSNYADRAGWKEIVVKPSAGAEVTVDPSLTVDRSDALLHYPAETLQSAPHVLSATFSWVAGSGADAPASAAAQTATEGRSGGGVAGVFDDLLRHNQSLGFVLLSLLIALVFGAQHALGPGHGKTMVAAYLVGSKGTPRQAVFLGLTVTATHTSTVYLLGIVTLVAAAYITPETLYLWMGLASGLLVVGFGAVLFATRLWGVRRRAEADGAHRHGLFGRAHTHPHTYDAGEEPHAGADHATSVAPDHALAGHEAHEAGAAVTWRSLLSLGFIGGLLPCPSAVVVMVAAISQGQIALGMLLIVAFSLGLAGVLIAIGVSLTLGKRIPRGKRRLFEHPLVGRMMTAMPVLSALIVMVAGLAITYQAWNQPGL